MSNKVQVKIIQTIHFIDEKEGINKLMSRSEVKQYFQI